MRSKSLSARALRHDKERACDLSFAPCLPGPERLVALGFRYWILGRDSGEIGCWERAFNLYNGHFGTAGARVALTQLSLWVTAVDNAARRSIEVFPERCRSFCRDECLAVSMIAACQHQTCPAMRACAFALAESARLEEVMETAQSFADAMLGLDQVLSTGSIVPALETITPVNQTLQ
ncbi:MAG: hypothetical protein R3D44_12420 [Hyphomicrobiaceae bacterium]